MHIRTFTASLAAILFSLSGLAAAQTVRTPALQPRLTSAIDGSTRITLPGSRPGRALAGNDIGEVPGSTAITGVTLIFNRSAAQQEALTALLAAQQDASSSQFHQWLTPAQFGAQFGLADADLSTVQSWLQTQGLSVTGVSPSRDRITVSGTAAQLAAAFGSPLHYYKSTADSQAHFAPATDLSLPAALAPTVLSVDNLSNFRLQPHVRLHPAFTSSQSGNHFVQPGDIATIYDINAAYNSGYTGAGVGIAIVGQSLIYPADIANFQSAAGVPVRPASLVLVPGSGTPTVYTGDESESDLDLEYSSAIAKGASIYFVYTGSNTNYGVLDALNYAVQQDIAPIISTSYGACEVVLGTSSISGLEATAAQAAAQGQTIFAASGDNGSTDCQEDTGLTPALRYGLAVDYPAASAYVTGVGGTEFPTVDSAATNATYFTAASGTDVVASAKSYIPEQAWNDDSGTTIASGGGGTSIYVARPTWQTGTIGGAAIPAGNYRLVPDVSLDSSSYSAPYLFCTSDTSAYSTGQSGSCVNGFRDANNTTLTVAGGTSFAAPIFAGMTALIVQAKGGGGLGLLNPTLYLLAANATTYASAFHDITTGSNACTGSSSVCISTSTTSNYAAIAGYDQATGLGSVDFKNLLTAYLAATASTSATSPSTVTLTPATTTPSRAVADAITITVTSNGTATATPTGNVTLTVDGSAVGTFNLVSGSYIYNFSSSTTGTHVITAVYSGDTNYSRSQATLSLTIGGSFTISASNIAVVAGATGTSTVTVTPAQGYTGTVGFVASASSLTNACYVIQNASVTSSAAATTTLTLYTKSSACSAAVSSGVHAFRVGATGAQARLWTPVSPGQERGTGRAPAYAALGGAAILLALLRRRSLGARLTSAISLGLLLVLGFGLTGCGSGTSVATSTTVANTPAGSYLITLTGTDTASSAISASTTLTVTVN